VSETARLGGIQFANSLPIELALEKKIITGPFDFFRLIPVELNRRMANAELDVSPVSSIFLARKPDELALIPDFAISSRSGVKSVLLFSEQPIQELMGVPIGFSGMGETTPTLLRILCNFRYGFEPKIVPESTQAELVIGDEALRAVGENRYEGWNRYDLAELWSDWTKLDFVFAVWVVRRNFIENPLFSKTLEALRKSKAWGIDHLAEVIREAQTYLSLEGDFLASYFGCIQYGLDPKCVAGINHFYELAAELKIIPRSLRVEDLLQVKTLL